MAPQASIDPETERLRQDEQKKGRRQGELEKKLTQAAATGCLGLSLILFALVTFVVVVMLIFGSAM